MSSEFDALFDDDVSLAIPKKAKKQPTLTEALFPRERAVVERRDVDFPTKGQLLTAEGLDVFSLPGRALAALPALAPGGETFKQSLERTTGKEREGFGGKLAEIGGTALRDPATTLTALLTGGFGAVPGLATKGAQALSLARKVPIIGKALPTLLAGAAESVPFAATRQAERAVVGKELSGSEALRDLALGAGLKGGTQIVKKIAKGLTPTAKKIVLSHLKPPNKAFTDGFDIDNAFELAPHGVTVSSTNNMLSTTTNLIREKAAIPAETFRKAAAKGGKLDVFDELSGAVDDLLAKKNSPDVGQLFFAPLSTGEQVAQNTPFEQALGRFYGLIDNISEDGVLPLDKANEFKQIVGGLGAWAHGTPDMELNATEAIANRFYVRLKDALLKKIPKGAKDVREAWDIMHKAIPIRNAAARVLPREQRSNILGLDNVIIGSNFLQDLATGAGRSKFNAALLAFNLILKNPKAAAVMNKVGKAAESVNRTIPKGIQHTVGATTRAAVKAPISASSKRARAQEALNDPEATPAEKEQAKRILGVLFQEEVPDVTGFEGL